MNKKQADDIDELLINSMRNASPIPSLVQVVQAVQGGLSGAQALVLVAAGMEYLHKFYEDPRAPKGLIPLGLILMRILEHLEKRCGCVAKECPFGEDFSPKSAVDNFVTPNDLNKLN